METDIIPFCIEKNIGINPYSPLSQGMLTGQLNRDTVLGDDDFIR
jgi:aryl-alcohol dehydrogenase-like predicted oxidoreductase